MRDMVGSQHSLKISAPKLFLRFRRDSVFKIFSQSIPQSTNYKGVFRSATGTPGLLNMYSEVKALSYEDQRYLTARGCILAFTNRLLKIKGPPQDLESVEYGT